MRLKRIKLAGFKSFVEPTTIPFDGDMTAIVGPNGCGKSNVIDAVRWVLGESNAKNLRGDAMTDVIFNGSAARKPVGQCSVELVFDNSTGRIAGEYARYNELSVKRLVTRDAQSFYYLNGAKCRRRDVTDLFLGTGLGPRSYAIIEQGMISKLIESKPQELRVFIEEAAGVSKYKERRKDTVTRIKHTHENLLRLDDVRHELGQQIDKLKEQAQTAQHYTELKAKQRTRQAQITALKWRFEADIIASCEHTIVQLTTDLAALQSTQQGDESQLIAHQFQLEQLHEQIATQQANKYQLATTITKLEQEQKYSQNRTAQLKSEIQDANAQRIAHEQALSGLDSQLEDAQRIVDALAPDHKNHEALYQQFSLDVTQAQAALAKFSSQIASHVTAFQQAKSESEQCHSQIHALESVIRKSKVGVEHVSQALQQVLTGAQELADEIMTQEGSLVEQRQVLAQQVAYKEQCATELAQSQTKAENLNKELNQLQQQLTKDDAALTVLETLQSTQTITHNTLFPSVPLWQWLDVTAQDTHWFETVLDFTQHPDITTCDSQTVFQAMAKQSTTSVHTWLETSFTHNKQANTLAEKCRNKQVPQWFNTIHLRPKQMLNDALIELNNLPVGDSILLEDGVWLQQGMIFQSGRVADEQVNSEQSLLIRSQQISDLNEKLLQLKQEMVTLTNTITKHQEAVSVLQADYDLANRTHEQGYLAFQLAEQAHQQRISQQQQNHKQQAKLEAEQESYAKTLAEELLQLETLNETFAELTISVAELSERQNDNIQNETKLKENLYGLQQSQQQAQQTLHQSELALQKARSSYSFVVQNKSNQQTLLADGQMKIRLLEDQLSALDEPYDIAHIQLMQLLEQQVVLDNESQALQVKASELSALIKQIEQGQHGNQLGAEKIRASIQAQELTLQGHRVRAGGFIEQLEQLDVSLDLILPELANDADAALLQRELEDIASHIVQLGAVNLAAIDEYNVQLERKTHLDQQNIDLCSALSTLEAAMKKIDNETKTRFKATYDQVNSDLKSLFPKVFGGGTAYLELTGDDMLDTGVTIMARPPGKKNSTIHLLSGGEKALTALSLVFAIFRLNPAPFCLLDEVDAPLDDANVGRFCKLVSEMSKTVQFIYISHNKIAMEMASHLTGVTMAEPGVSRMVAVDIDEAVAITQA